MNENTSVGIAEQFNVVSNEPIDGNLSLPHFVVKTESRFSNVYVVQAPDMMSAVEFVLDSQNPPDFIQAHLGERAVHVEKTTCTDVHGIKSQYPNYF